MESIIKPSMTLSDIFGPNHLMNPRVSFLHHRWVDPDIDVQDFKTGAILPIVGDMPFICHESVASSSVLSVLQSANLQVALPLFTYRNKNEYAELLAASLQKKRKVVMNFPHLPDELDQEQYLIKPSLLRFLNNKANLATLVPSRHVPRRFLLSPADLWDRQKRPLALPFVVKLATDEPTGGGFDIVICKKEADINRTSHLFEAYPLVVIEDYLPIKFNFCIQFAITATGEIVYLGASEQVIGEHGDYRGNWIDHHHQPDAAMVEIGKRVAKRAQALGYCGIAGMDIVMTENEQIFVIDLNFRLNASTPALLLQNSIRQAFHTPVLKFGRWKAFKSMQEAARTIDSACKDKYLVPISIYHGTEGTPLLLAGIIAGSSREEIAEKERHWEMSGFQ